MAYQLSIIQAADKAHVHPMTIRRWIAEGRLKATRVGPRLIRISSDDLEKLFTPMGAD